MVASRFLLGGALHSVRENIAALTAATLISHVELSEPSCSCGHRPFAEAEGSARGLKEERVSGGQGNDGEATTRVHRRRHSWQQARTRSTT